MLLASTRFGFWSVSRTASPTGDTIHTAGSVDKLFSRGEGVQCVCLNVVKLIQIFLKRGGGTVCVSECGETHLNYFQEGRGYGMCVRLWRNSSCVSLINFDPRKPKLIITIPPHGPCQPIGRGPVAWIYSKRVILAATVRSIIIGAVEFWDTWQEHCFVGTLYHSVLIVSLHQAD